MRFPINGLLKGALVVIGATGFLACSEEMQEGADNAITLAGQFNTAGHNKPGAMSKSSDLSAMAAITDYDFYCVSFEALPHAATSSIESDGSFSLQMPKGVPFGCFVTNDGTPVATVRVVDSTNSGMNSENSDSFNLNQNVDFGPLNLDLTSGEVAVDPSKIADAKNTDSSGGLDISTLHNSSYNLSCVDTGDAQCSGFVQESPSVYFRVMSGSESGEAVNGLGVWSSASAFSGCGSKDMTVDQRNAIEGDGFMFDADGITTGAFSTSNASAGSCPTHGEVDPNVIANYPDNVGPAHLIQDYYAAAPLARSGKGYTMTQREDYSFDDGSGNTCSVVYNMSVTFSPSGSAGDLVGAFMMSEKHSESLSGACGDRSDMNASFVVKFAKQ